MKRLNKLLKEVRYSKLISFFLIPLVLVVFWYFCVLFFNGHISYSVLEYGSETIPVSSSGRLMKGEKIKGNFIAKDNYLGMVVVRFNRYVKPDFRGEDVLSFKLKKTGSKEWYYFNNYRSGLLENKLLLPFGFPAIQDSKNNKFEFEIESLYGNTTNAVEVSKDLPIVLTAYQYPKAEITGSKLRMITFLIKKTITNFTNFDIFFSSIQYLLPLLFYLLWLFLAKKYIFSRQGLLFILILLVLVDIFLIKEIYIGIVIGLLIGWIVAVKSCNLDSSISFLLSFLFIASWIASVLIGREFLSDKLNIWTFSFMLIGSMQMVIEEKFDLKKLKDYKFIIKKIFER